MKRWVQGLLGLIALFVAAATLAAPGPEEVIRGTTDKVLARVKADEAILKADTSKLYGLVNELIIPNFDFDRASQLVLGKYWRQTDTSQRARFVEAFKQLLVRTYANALFQFVDEKIVYKDNRTDGDGKTVVVRTEIEKPNAQPIPVNYRMHQKDGEWKAYDVFVDGISLVVTYRESFASEIGQSGIEALISHMETHNQDLAANAVNNTVK